MQPRLRGAWESDLSRLFFCVCLVSIGVISVPRYETKSSFGLDADTLASGVSAITAAYAFLQHLQPGVPQMMASVMRGTYCRMSCVTKDSGAGHNLDVYLSTFCNKFLVRPARKRIFQLRTILTTVLCS